MQENLMRIIENFKSVKLLVIGDAILDMYVITTPEKFGREAPVPVFNVQQYNHQCGGAANTAINVATLGAETFFLTVTGKDSGAKHLNDLLRQNKVHTEYIVKDKSRRTVVKQRVTASSNILFRIDSGTTTAVNEQTEKELLRRLNELYAHIDAVIISDYDNGVFTNAMIDSIKKLSELHHKHVIVDAKDLRKFKAVKPSAVKPNYEESLKILNIEKLEHHKRVEQILQHQQKLFEVTGATKIAATLDADGVVFFEEGKEPYTIPCVAREDKKSIGAGDTFTSALALALALNADGRTAAEIAAAAAAVVMQKEGTAGCTNSELKHYFNEVPKHILSVEELVNIVKELKKHNKKIVFTNGCFDIIHSGHIYLLNNARKAGDVLIVGVNSDESIRQLKGKDRPINRLSDRITVLAGLQSVDYLIVFDEDSPADLIKAIEPDVFVKGGNYTEDSIPEAALLKKIGCTVKIVPYMEERSTTHIIDKIRDAQQEGAPVKEI